MGHLERVGKNLQERFYYGFSIYMAEIMRADGDSDKVQPYKKENSRRIFSFYYLKAKFI